MAHGLSDIESISAAVQQRCRKDGPVAELWEAVNDMRDSITTINNELAERKGADKAQARNLTLIVGIASVINVAAAVLGLLWKIRHG